MSYASKARDVRQEKARADGGDETERRVRAPLRVKEALDDVPGREGAGLP